MKSSCSISNSPARPSGATGRAREAGRRAARASCSPRQVLASAAGALACLALAACGPGPSKTTGEPDALPPADVVVVRVHPDPATSAEDAPGTVRPVESAILSSKVSGTVTEIDADPGRAVKSGDLLARIDDREIRARLDNARATLEQAERDFSRFQKLHADRVITTQEFEAAQTRLRTAQAAEKEARTLLGYTSVVSPFDGVVTRRFVQRGDLAVPGRPLVEVENPGRLRLEAQVPESLVPGLSVGEEIAVAVDAANATLAGKVAEIAPASDPASRTTLVKIDLPETPGLRSGQFGRARIPTSSEPSIRLPSRAISSRGQLDFVFVADGGRAKLRIVRTGRLDGGFTEILSGLDPGETVVVEHPPDLADGRAIRERTAQSQPAQP